MVMEEELGRKLLPGEIVHHKDENKRNNDKNNLELTCPKDHGKHHIKVLSDSQKKERFRKIADSRERNNNTVRGTKIKISKLNEDKVRIIRLRLSSGEQVKSIAKDFGVNESTIRGIRDKVLWKHILES